MQFFSISQLEQFSGIKSHTIRMWERRYKALQPGRTDGNTRYYEDSQLRRLLNIVSLLQSEYKVSELCLMTDEQLFLLINELSNSVDIKTTEYFVLQLMDAGIRYDEVHFSNLLAQCLESYGMKDTYIKILFPLLVRIGLMWTSDSISPSHEHFMVSIIRQKLYAAIDSLPPVKSTSNAWLLFQPEYEFHEIGLLISNYLIRLSGRKVIYLGSNIPLNTVSNVIKETSPVILLLFLVHNDFSEYTRQYIDTLSTIMKMGKIYIAGSQKVLSQFRPNENVEWLYSINDLEAILLV